MSDDKVIKIRDYVAAYSEKTNQPIFRLHDQVNDQGDQVLYATFRITHAARITGNNKLYLPGKVKDAVPSLTHPYGKPVGVHHKENEDPVGRIKAATYVSTAPNIPLRINGLDRLYDASSDINHQLDILDALSASKAIYNKKWEGLGHVIASAVIGDKDAIKKIKDERYSTVSIDMVTNHLYCSKCRTDWRTETCDHTPGQDGCYFVTGDIQFNGFDFVNRPADDLASLISFSEPNSGINPTFASRHITNSVDFSSAGIVITDSLISPEQYNLITLENDSKDLTMDTQEPVIELTIADSVDTEPSTCTTPGHETEPCDCDILIGQPCPNEPVGETVNVEVTTSGDTTTVQVVDSTVVVDANIAISDALSAELMSIKDALVKTKHDLEEANTSVKVLRDELRLASSDYTVTSKYSLAMTDTLRAVVIEQLCLYYKLRDNSELDKDLYQHLPIEVLVNKLDTIKNSVDVKSITDKLFDGTKTIVNSEPVQDPTVETEHTSTTSVVDSLSQPEQQIFAKFRTINDELGKTKAVAYLRNLKQQRIIRDDTKYINLLESITTVVQ